MTKKFLFFLYLTGIGMGTQAQTTISANISDYPQGKIKVSRIVGNRQILDSLDVKNGQFEWKLDISKPEKVNLVFDRRKVFQFYAEPGKQFVSGSAKSINQLVVKGSKTQEEKQEYDHKRSLIYQRGESLYEQLGKASGPQKEIIEGEMLALNAELEKFDSEFIALHPNSLNSLDIVVRESSYASYEEVNAKFNLLSPELKAAAKQVSARLAILERSMNGAKMTDFNLLDNAGNPVTLESLKGKYILVDFWASWCKPCRAENPNVLAAFNAYKDKGFSVLGISIDDSEENWKKAIVEDGMPWTHVRDRKQGKSEILSFYGINGIPSSLLIDPNGTIIGKNLRGPALSKKLAEIFAKQSGK